MFLVLSSCLVRTIIIACFNCLFLEIHLVLKSMRQIVVVAMITMIRLIIMLSLMIMVIIFAMMMDGGCKKNSSDFDHSVVIDIEYNAC